MALLTILHQPYCSRDFVEVEVEAKWIGQNLAVHLCPGAKRAWRLTHLGSRKSLGNILKPDQRSAATMTAAIALAKKWDAIAEFTEESLPSWPHAGHLYREIRGAQF